MRLEIDSAVAPPPMPDEAANPFVDPAEVKSILNQGIKAAQAGNRVQARTSLLRVTELDSRNESAWLWLASISEYPEELLGFLNHVLDVNPENERALEWKAATNSLLAKTFVQRGIDACNEGRSEFGAECFRTALEHDESNGAAWMWLASLADSNTVRITMLERAVDLDPANDSAANALEDAKKKVLTDRMTEAKTAAVAGNNGEAIAILDDLLAVNPDSVDAWTLRSHLAEGFDEKIRCFESILAIDPENVAARAGRDSLLNIFGTVEAAKVENEVQPEVAEVATEEPAGSAHLTYFSEPANEDTQSLNEEDNANEIMDPAPESPAEVAKETPELQTVTFDVSHDNSPEEVAFDDVAETAYADPQMETVTVSYDEVVTPAEADDSGEHDDTTDSEEPSVSGEFVIPMPDLELPATETPDEAAPVTVIEDPVAETVHVKVESFECPFCSKATDVQSITCPNCQAVLTLSDMELLLANQNADKLTLRHTVEEMERGRSLRELSVDELVVLGLGHLNLRNFQLGYACLAEASKLSPNNVVLGGQVNSLLIRLEEIKLQEEAHLKMPKGKSILVVDDSPTVRKLISGKLEKSGHEVICANDGVEAMERLESLVPDLVLLDINMPRMDGYQVCKNIRSKASTKDVPVVMISGKDGFFDKVRGRMAGTTGYITKPFGPETLMKAVEMYLSGQAPEIEEV